MFGSISGSFCWAILRILCFLPNTILKIFKTYQFFGAVQKRSNVLQTVEFEAKLTGPGLIIKNHQLTVVCYYQEEYQVDLEFGQLEMETQRGDGVENEAIQADRHKNVVLE